MKGKLKNTEFKIGDNNTFDKIEGGKVVEIIDVEEYYVYGKRYKIRGFDEWFEANCFEYISGE